MKKFTLFIALVLTAVFGVKTTASAQTYETEEQIKWINYAITFDEAKSASDGIYLCHWDSQNNKYTFVNAGGEYGTQAIASNRGMKLTVTGSLTNAVFTGTLYNPTEGTSLGMEPSSDRVFLDRKDSWKLSDYQIETNTTTGTVNKTYYYIQNTERQYLGITTDNTLLVYNTNPSDSRWLLIPRTAFRQVLLDVTHQTNIEVSGLFQNTRFVRYMDRKSSWEWWTINGTSPGTQLTEDNVDKDNGIGLGIKDYKAYRSMAPGIEYEVKGVTVPGHGENESISNFDYAKSYGSFSAAEMKSPIVMRQQISGIRPGTYTITAQAFVSDDANDMSDQDQDNRNIGFLFAAGTSGVNQGAEVPVLKPEEQTNFTNNFYNYHKKVIKAAAKGDTDQEEVLIQKYFRGNVAAGEYLATGGDYTLSSDAIYNPNTTFKTITLNVTVTDSGDGTGTLTIGAAKYHEQGTLYIANIDIKYSGTYEFGINSYGTDNTAFSETNTDGIDGYQYGYARQFNLARDFGETSTTSKDKIANPKWEALVLPVNLTTTQVRNTFGDDVQLSKLVGLANGGKQIRFEAVDLASDPNATAILAGECYVIKVTKAPEVARNGSYKFQVYSNDEFTENKPVDVTYPSPIYQIDGVTRTSKLTDLIASYADGVVTKTYTTDDGSLNFTGYFYWNQTGVNNAYVVSRGKMFYLETPWKNLTGTMWKLEDPTLNPGEAKDISIDFGDGTITNGISDITADEENTNVTGVYNLNGQKVSDGTTTDNLPKGIYIVNGKKHVVR